jgi:serpin B
MNRNLIVPLVIGALLIASLALASCGEPTQTTTTAGGPSTTAGNAGDTTGGTTGQTTLSTALSKDGVTMAASPIARVAASATRADILSAATGINAFGADLYAVLAQSGNGNLVFSPASIELALAMTYAGANGDTAVEMAKVLHFALQGDALHQSFNSLDTLLESRSWQGKNDEGKDEGVLVKTANSLWGQKDLTFEKLFLDTLAKDYGAGMRLVDYRTAAEDARKTINKWVANQTNDKIEELVPAGALDALTRLVLVNAVYLDATWASQFDKGDTRDGSFTTLAGPAVTAPMMSQSAGFPYAKGDGWQAVELPYARDQLAMLLIVPDQGRFKDVEAALATGLVDQAVAALATNGAVQLTMPRFEFRTQASLAEALKALGMPKAFGDTADFSAMTKQEPLRVSKVIHEAFIAVDEEGTEAAATTAVIVEESAAFSPAVQLTVDRPFLFALRDRDTGAVLFLGRVTDPTVG